ncbi:pentatricopeptide repeat-containing protein At3g51320 [Punica granatum]|uniref:Pentatricopeptide repeat-containing protein At3g51320 n=1 Tax=Punica granatum TaxID=22663 RepID=A0A218W1Q3_PUNGR|nr:pentatricopeptide repeat-containing protein At3g51320 [Punica granatum]OWM66463.1 hypothetical protein CDL15_Pgr013680 [Punica granatum]
MARASLRPLLQRLHPTPLTATVPVTAPSKSNPRAYSTPSSKTPPLSNYHRALYLLDSCRCAHHLSQVHALIITSGLIASPALSRLVLKVSADLGSLSHAVLVFPTIKDPHVFCINNMIRAYSTSTVPEDGISFYFKMLSNGFMPNSYTFVLLIGCSSTMRCIGSGKMCHAQAIKHAVDEVLQVQNSLIRMYAYNGADEFAWKLFDKMPHRDVVSWNSMISGLVESGDLVTAHRLFDRLPKRNVVTYNVLISGYLRGGNPGVGLKLFREMAREGLQGNAATLSSIITVCGRSARLKEGKSVHGFLIKTFSRSNVILDTALIDMYSKCGRVDLACSLFEKMETRNTICLNAMISGHSIHGNPLDGLQLFEDVVKGIRVEYGDFPDEVTFIGVLCACARAELLTEGRNYLTQMTETFGIKPNFAHYWCMANLLSGVGLAEEAEEMLRNIPNDDVPSQSSVWVNLLSSCRFRGAAALGERIANSLRVKDPRNFSYYRLLVNVYAVAGQWDDVARLKEDLKKEGSGRIPSCGLVDLKEIVHGLELGEDLQQYIETDQFRVAITTEQL